MSGVCQLSILTCFYIRPFDVLTLDLFLSTFDLKYPHKLHLKCILYQNFNSFLIFGIEWQSGKAVVHGGLSAVRW